MLQNRIYRGEIVHKDQSYPGEHEAIIDPALWDAAQARLAENAVERGTGIRVRNPSLLTGLLFDGEGHRMTPTHAVKKGRRRRRSAEFKHIPPVIDAEPGRPSRHPW
jgi:site-specific DNA recombinase